MPEPVQRRIDWLSRRIYNLVDAWKVRAEVTLARLNKSQARRGRTLIAKVEQAVGSQGGSGSCLDSGLVV